MLSASYLDDKIAWYENQTRPNIAEFLLIDAQADQIVQPLADGAVLDVSSLDLRIFSVMAVADNPRLPTVRFHLTGPITQTQLDWTSPFTLFGENSTDYYGEEPLPGDYTVTATPYTEANDGTLVAGSPTTLNFTISEPSTAALGWDAAQWDTAQRSAARVYPNSFRMNF